MISQKFEIDGAIEAGAPSALRVAVCGEVSSGKSTVLNALLRARILPDNIGQKVRPVVVAKYREQAGMEIQHADGKLAQHDLPGEPSLFSGAEQVRIWSNHPHLMGIELIEVPLTKAEELTDEQVALISSCDVMVWVTIASQAWRLTEKTIVEQLGDARPQHCILAVTRADKLRNTHDRTRLRDRIVRETKHLFDSCIFMSGARQKISKAGQSDAAWIETGGADMISTFKSLAGRIRTRRGEPEVAEPALTPEISEAPEEVVEVADVPEAQSTPVAEAVEASVEDIEIADSEVAEPEVEDAEPQVEEQVAEPVVAESTPPASLASEELRAMVADLAGAVVVGLRPHEGSQGCETLLGDAEQCGHVSDFCHQSYTALTHAAETDPSVGPVSSFNLSMQGHRFLFQNLPDVGLVFLMVDASVMSHGIAQSTLKRIEKSFGA